jgi:hypothetical protein
MFALWAKRCDNAVPWCGYAVMNILNDTFIVKFDEMLQSILIIHPDEDLVPGPLVRIRMESLNNMNFLEASQFLGERLFLLIPQLRERYAEELAKLASGSDQQKT